jgi:hypothetical protein
VINLPPYKGMMKVKCGFCKSVFDIRISQYDARMSQERKNYYPKKICCSKECADKLHSKRMNKYYDINNLNPLLDGLNEYKESNLN